ncbi:MAG: glycosyltransferase family 4 protein [Candidatus Magasanikbacteria bacterium]|nr:glycosyltransferase family 4 protein [Candidatus Magasanikbacteria bacterium]
MKKVLIISMEFPPQIGGIATYVDQLARGLQNASVLVLANPHKEAKDFDASRGYRIIRKNILSPRFTWPRWLFGCFRLFFLCRKEKIDLLMIHHMLPVGYMAWFVKKFMRIPYLVFSHGTDLGAALRHPWKKIMLQQVLRHSEQLIVNSESLRSRALQALPRLKEKTMVLYPGPEPYFFEQSPEEERLSLKDTLALEGKKVILSIGRLVEGKGFANMVSVLSEVVKKYPTLVWLVIGDGPKYDVLVQLVQKQHLQDIVRFIGEVPHADLRVYYQSSDIFMLLTHPHDGFEEGIGLVFLEAAASGLPVIAGDSGGVRDAVVHAKTGFVVQAAQHKNVADMLLGLLKDEMFAKRLGLAGRERVASEFNWDHQLNRLSPWL